MHRIATQTSRHVMIACVLALALTACGKKGSPKPPEGKEITYPRTYPTR